MRSPHTAAWIIGILAGLVIWAIGILIQIWAIPFGSPSQVAKFWLAYIGIVLFIILTSYAQSQKGK